MDQQIASYHGRTLPQTARRMWTANYGARMWTECLHLQQIEEVPASS